MTVSHYENTNNINDALTPKQPIMGVRLLPTGHLDLSRAAVVSFPETTPPAAPSLAERRAIASANLSEITHRTEAWGIDEQQLKSLTRMVSNARTPAWQLSALRVVIGRDGLNTQPTELRQLVLGHNKEETRATAEGVVFHYHQTGMDGLAGIVHHGAVLPFEAQKERGIATGNSGSRPDVVQFTRDDYGPDGKLRKPGIDPETKMGGTDGSVALIFDESIMDRPDYDGVVRYPNATAAPLTHLHAVAVGSPEAIPDAQRILADNEIDVPVVTRQQWLDRYQ